MSKRTQLEQHLAAVFVTPITWLSLKEIQNKTIIAMADPKLLAAPVKEHATELTKKFFDFFKIEHVDVHDMIKIYNTDMVHILNSGHQEVLFCQIQDHPLIIAPTRYFYDNLATLSKSMKKNYDTMIYLYFNNYASSIEILNVIYNAFKEFYLAPSSGISASNLGTLDIIQFIKGCNFFEDYTPENAYQIRCFPLNNQLLFIKHGLFKDIYSSFLDQARELFLKYEKNARTQDINPEQFQKEIMADIEKLRIALVDKLNNASTIVSANFNVSSLEAYSLAQRSGKGKNSQESVSVQPNTTYVTKTNNNSQ